MLYIPEIKVLKKKNLLRSDKKKMSYLFICKYFLAGDKKNKLYTPFIQNIEILANFFEEKLICLKHVFF